VYRVVCGVIFAAYYPLRQKRRVDGRLTERIAAVFFGRYAERSVIGRVRICYVRCRFAREISVSAWRIRSFFP
ncbi:MAG: hypothetical protein II135_11780, partial [Clostridia bacterium]|nr:hypothetical protein [Clostridia bacterium]